MPESIYQRRELIMKNKLNNREKHQGQSREVRGNVEKIGDPVILSLPADLRFFSLFSIMHEGDTKPKGVHRLNKKYSSETLM